MLVLSRRRDQAIMVGDDIEITVVDIRGDKVRLGINAPKEISVHRKEVYDQIRKDNRVAAQAKPEDFAGFGKPIPAPDKTPCPENPQQFDKVVDVPIVDGKFKISSSDLQNPTSQAQ